MASSGLVSVRVKELVEKSGVVLSFEMSWPNEEGDKEREKLRRSLQHQISQPEITMFSIEI